MAFKAYSIIDIYSREIVGWRVEQRESDDLAVDMFKTAFAALGLPAIRFPNRSSARRKYRPNYPGVFDDLDAARACVNSYVSWYNQHHRHSGIALFNPAEVHNGRWMQQWHQHDQALQTYYDAHPERFCHRPYTKSPSPVVGLNLPAENDTDRLHAV